MKERNLFVHLSGSEHSPSEELTDPPKTNEGGFCDDSPTIIDKIIDIAEHNFPIFKRMTIDKLLRIIYRGRNK